jgi:hypothetical protein
MDDKEFQKYMKNAAEQMLIHIFDTEYYKMWMNKYREDNRRGRPKKKQYPTVNEIKDLIIEDCISTYGLKSGFYLKKINRDICDYCNKKQTCKNPSRGLYAYCSEFED